MMDRFRRHLLITPFLFLACAAHADDGTWAELRGSEIVLFRHANAPGTGDPTGFVVGDCSTQRNLDEQGRVQARAIGAAFRSRGIRVGRVLSSQWCRTRETAELAFPGQVSLEPAFNSFFGNRESEARQTAEAQRVLRGWAGPGVLVVVTHQVNITALTGIAPRSGEGIVLRREGGELVVLGRLQAPDA
jgi:phosphohistidine phosphatase SixA